jgi:hypothetical protein
VKKAAAGKKAAGKKPAAAKARHARMQGRTIPELLGSLHPGNGYFAPQLDLAGSKGA